MAETETVVRESATDHMAHATEEWTRPAIAPIDLPTYAEPQTRRDSVRRRLLALADVLGIITADLLIWLLIPPPPCTTCERVARVSADERDRRRKRARVNRAGRTPPDRPQQSRGTSAAA